MHTALSTHRGFSILMALGSIGVLMIIAIGMVSVFLTEMKLSRLQYDSILSSTQAEWVFEYAMLKIKNHKDGFADSLTPSSPDASIWQGSTPRTDGVSVAYKIRSQSKKYTFSGGLDTYTIIPLFTGMCQDFLDDTSCNPSEYGATDSVRKIIKLATSGNPENLSWSIVAMDGTENISLSGTGNIDGTEKWVMRIRDEECLDDAWATISCTSSLSAENLVYFYDKQGSTEAFLTQAAGTDFSDIIVKKPYLLIYSSDMTPVDITLETDAPFTLPTREVIAEARKWESVQVVRFREDKSKYYDALKFSIYNAE